MKINPFALVIAFLLGTINLALAQEKTVNETYDNIKRIELNIISGNLEIGASSSDQVQVTGTYDEQQIQVKISNSNGKLVIEEKSRQNRMNRSSRWTLLVPNELKINSNSASGNVTVEDIAVNLYSNTGSGNYTFSAVQGRLQLNTGSGNVNIDDSDAAFNCNTGSGNVGVNGSKGNLSLNTGSGNIILDNSGGSISANTGSGQVRGTNMNLTGPSSFNTGSGNATVGLSTSPKGDLSVNSGSGNASLALNGVSFNGELVMQCNEKNGRISAPFSFDSEKVISNGKYHKTLRKEKRFGSGGTQIQVSTGSGSAKVSK